ncbi:hypothetical protein XA68_16191 [Ophiocordyceps unilateralis]|uniref:DNA polymerase delta subunit 4 n=1 Tax=Ophiocordyceps unilateralis TaxID=268505 RepID=A0A2A9P706_OPHUN|nr:hypothetical protein XA68_16191 [Ophiocordyceps unilateralis]
MPATRRHAAGARANRPSAGKAQSTLSFSGRVTKSTARDDKKVITPASMAKVPQIQNETAEDDEDEEEEADVEADDSHETQQTEASQDQRHERTEAEARAEQISDAQISSYWRTVERQRKAPRVHQDDLDVCEKVLRYFDVSSQYGPCIGISRMKRWLRAHRLGLNPPIEVLAVLVKGEAKGNKDMDTAKIDGILNAIVVGT